MTDQTQTTTERQIAMVTVPRSAVERLILAADSYGVAHLDSDDMDDDATELQDATEVMKDHLTTLQPLAIGLDREVRERLEKALLSIDRIFPVHVTETPDYADLAFNECRTQAMTVEPDTWTALNTLGDDLRSLLALAAPAEPLWMMHVRGPDDIYPAPDYETALAWSDYVNDVMAKAVPEVMTKAVPAIWTGTPERHANGLPEAIKGWTLPAAPTGETGA